MRFFTDESTLIGYGVQYLRLVSPSYLLCGISQMYLCIMKNSGRALQSTVIAGIFCAGGDSRFGFFCDTVVMWLIAVPAGLIAAFLLELPVAAVFCIINLDEMLKLPAVYRHYKKYLWVKDLTVREAQEQ